MPGQRGKHRRRHRKPVAIIAVLAIVVVSAGVAGVAYQLHRSAQARSRRELQQVASSYLAAWTSSNWNAMRALVAQPSADFVQQNETFFSALRVTKWQYSLGSTTMRGTGATAPFDAKLDVSGLGQWTYRGRLNLVRPQGAWKVQWSPSTLHPALRASLHVARTRDWGTRAAILSRDGTPLTVLGDAVEVGVQPSRITDRAKLLDALKRFAGVDPKQAARQLDAPGVQPTWFIPVAQLSKSQYAAVKSRLYPVPGTVFRTVKVHMLRSPGFAGPVVGVTGEVTKELLGKLGEPYEAGDVVGLSGLEYAFQRQLAGTPSGKVEAVDGQGNVVKTLFSVPATAPRPVMTTLDVATQQAAENALTGVTENAAVVAIDAKTGQIRAVANRPADGFDRALDGTYPPGSTFKVVTSTALVEHGMSPTDPITCPPTVTVGGKSFKNFEGESLGTIDFQTAFARSCNTAFIQMAETLGPNDLRKAAEEYGFNSEISLPLAASGGSFPDPKDDAERAASAIGQGRVLASPLELASVAAAVDSGRWRAPTLLDGARSSSSHTMSASVGDDLRAMMRQVVTGGTGTAANLPGLKVSGKTGTAEFGNGTQTHAWFIGFDGNLAFAVIVEGGGVGGQVAAPIAAKFLLNLTSD